MSTNWLEYAGIVQLVVVAILLAALLGWQRRRPGRSDAGPRRELRNIGLMAIASIVVRLLIPISSVTFLPTDQARLEAENRLLLWDNFGIVFNHLYALGNMPIQRFG
jgi:hypothetical protein